MMESSLTKKMEMILSLLNELYQISIHQQRLLSEGNFDELSATFEQRQILFERLQALKQEVDCAIGDPLFESDTFVESFRQQSNSSLQSFLQADQRVSFLLGLHLERIGVTLLQRLKAKDAVQNYKRIEVATNRIAQVFPGNARYTDIQK